MRVDDSRLLGIPRWRSIIAMIYPQHDRFSKDYPDLSVKVLSRRPSGLRKTRRESNSLAHRTTWLRSDFTKGRDVINASWWLAFTRNSSLKINNCNDLSPARPVFKRLPRLISQGFMLDEPISVARVRPRTSKGITDLLLPRTSFGYSPKVPLRSQSKPKRV